MTDQNTKIARLDINCILETWLTLDEKKTNLNDFSIADQA
jgi:hypothetical protein